MNPKREFRYLKATWQYFWDKGAQLMLLTVVPALLLTFLYSPSSALYYLYTFDIAEITSWVGIYSALRSLPYAWLYWVGIIGFVTLIISIAIQLGTIDRHMRVGEFTISFRKAKSRINYNVLTSLKLVAVAAVVLELSNLITVTLYWIWALVATSTTAWLVLSSLTVLLIVVLELTLLSWIILWPTYMLHTGMSSTDAFRTALQSVKGHVGEIALTIVTAMLPIEIVITVTAALDCGTICRVILDGLAYTIIIPFYLSLMYTIFYDVTGTERTDLNKVDIWSKKVK